MKRLVSVFLLLLAAQFGLHCKANAQTHASGRDNDRIAGSGLSAEQIRQISQIASSAMETNRLPGLSVAVSKDNEIWSAGFGKADLEQDVPVTVQSMFRTASVAKWFTATAAMRLVEDGKLDLDAPVQQYCPIFPQKQWPITSRQLLTHMSGVRHNYGSNGEKRDTETERQALDELIQLEKATQYTRYTDVIKPLDTSHRGPRCSFDAFLDEFDLHDPVLDRLAIIVRAADTATLELSREAPGLLAISLGMSAA